jgi:serine/threonine protein kinase
VGWRQEIAMREKCQRCSCEIPSGENRCPHCGREHDDPGANSFFFSGDPRNQPDQVELDPGTELKGRFTIREKLGCGTTGTVYLAEDSIRGEKVALKAVEVGPCSSNTASRVLQEELRLHSSIKDNHHVVQVHDLFFASFQGTGFMLLAMEYADGGTLREWLLDHKTELQVRREQGLVLFRQVCRGVQAIHEVSAVHLDLKPENFLFVDGKIKVSDFGAASCASYLRGSTLNAQEFPSLQRGTAPYMSPEQFTVPHPEDLDQRSDIYALGINLYEICHPGCHAPFGGDFQRLQNLHCHATPPSLPGVSERIRKAASRCLEKDAHKRFRTVGELLGELDGTGEQVKEVDDVWCMAQAAYEGKDLNSATRHCRHIVDEDPQHRGAAAMLKEIEERYDEAERFYQSVRDDLGHTNLAELAELVADATHIYPDHPSGRLIQRKLVIRSRRYRESMEVAAESATKGDWQTARAQFENAAQLNPHDPGARKGIDMCTTILNRIGERRRAIDDATEAGDFQKALALGRSLDRYLEEVARTLQHWEGRRDE